MIETISLMYNIYIVDTILLLVRVNSTYATNVENKLFCWIFVTKGGPGANGRVLLPVTGRSQVRVMVFSHCTGEGKACH